MSDELEPMARELAEKMWNLLIVPLMPQTEEVYVLLLASLRKVRRAALEDVGEAFGGDPRALKRIREER